MVKAEEFWKYLCEELNYRFFSGVVHSDIAPLYKGMDANIMHYIPAATEKIAFGMASGVFAGGFKGGALMNLNLIYDLTSTIEFNIEYRIPLLIMGCGNEDTHLVYELPEVYIDTDAFKQKLKTVTSEMEAEGLPGLVIINKEVLV